MVCRFQEKCIFQKKIFRGNWRESLQKITVYYGQNYGARNGLFLLIYSIKFFFTAQRMCDSWGEVISPRFDDKECTQPH